VLGSYLVVALCEFRDCLLVGLFYHLWDHESWYQAIAERDDNQQRTSKIEERKKQKAKSKKQKSKK
jgi:DNA-binding transcriptional regulator/RsmH inhibitor MraZ